MEEFTIKAEHIADVVTNTDVLIVGTEAAGAYAGIKASESDVRVTLVTKGRDMAQSGASITASGSSNAVDSRTALELCGEGDERDSPELFFEDVVRAGRWVCNQRLAEIMCKTMPRLCREMAEWGVKWSHLAWTPGHTYSRDLYASAMDPNNPRRVLWGPVILKTMKNVMRERENVEIVGDTLVLDLLTLNGRIGGAAALNIATGEFIVYKAKSVVLATGGSQAVWPRLTTGKENTGDGHAMAYRAGAELIDPQFMQIMPDFVLWRPRLSEELENLEEFGWDPSTGFLIRLPVIGLGHYLNRVSRRYMRNWDPVLYEIRERDVRGTGLAYEVYRGRGTKRGGVYVSIKHVPINTIKEYFGEQWETSQATRELTEKMCNEGIALEAGLMAHFNLGGIKMNEKCETNIRGLYAAGECTGGTLGANRMSGTALSECLVHGAISGKYAGEYAQKAQAAEIDAKQLENIRDRVFQPLKRKEGVQPIEYTKRIRELAARTVSPVRNGSDLEKGIEDVERMKTKESPMLYTEAKDTIYNLEWIEAIQAVNLLQMLEILLRSALYRTETRGGHYRMDYPMTNNDDWLKNVIVKRVGKEMQLTAHPVVITRIKPPAGKLPWPAPRHMPDWLK